MNGFSFEELNPEDARGYSNSTGKKSVINKTILDYLNNDNNDDNDIEGDFTPPPVIGGNGYNGYRINLPWQQSGGDNNSFKDSLADFSDDEEDETDEDSQNDNPRVPTVYTKLIIENDTLIKGDPFSTEYAKASCSILKLLEIRDNYIMPKSEYSGVADLIEFQPPSSEPIIMHAKLDKFPEPLENVEMKNINGVYVPIIDGKPVCNVITLKQYLSDMSLLFRETYDRSIKSFCHKRLCLLSEKFNMHLLFNREKEFFEQKVNIHRDFYNLRKVDNLIAHVAAANVNTFLKFVKQKSITEKDTPVFLDEKTNKVLTFDEVLEKYNLKTRVVTIEDLEIQSYLESFRQNRRIEQTSEPTRKQVIGDIFTRRENLMSGRFRAELTHALFKEYKEYKFQLSEYRISLDGKSADDWNNLAEWIDSFKLYDQRVRWLVQIPRLYDLLHKEKKIENYQQMLDNIFQPLFQVTINPESNPKLYKVLLTIVGFDTIDDETGYTLNSNPNIFGTLPSQWTSEENPHYSYWAYYLWANLYSLNSLRKMRGLNTFAFRPHVSETGSPEQLMSTYLLADGISRGILLKKAPLLQYLFYLKQIGISMSPLSDNKLYLKYKDNPFPDFFARGLNVSLSTDHPLLYHMTSQPLIEEYSVASQVFDFSASDICELARNSIIQCGFEDTLKSYWIGENHKEMTPRGNDEKKTNVPQARFLYRVETLSNEIKDLKVIARTSYE